MYGPPPGPPPMPRARPPRHGVPALGVIALCALSLLAGCVGGAAIASTPESTKNAGNSATATASTTRSPAIRKTGADDGRRKTAKPTPRRSAAKPRPRPRRTTAPTTDRRYPSCAAANRAGHGPYVRGVNPEYRWYQDRDGDGVVCERR
ncbi:excalibur calcium-binding domain-containing protein [Spirillospora sp. NBC_00431]